MSRSDIVLLADGLTVADLIRALRRSDLCVSQGAFPNMFVVNVKPRRFPGADNVIDLAAELPSLLKPQIGPTS